MTKIFIAMIVSAFLLLVDYNDVSAQSQSGPQCSACNCGCMQVNLPCECCYRRQPMPPVAYRLVPISPRAAWLSQQRDGFNYRWLPGDAFRGRGTIVYPPNARPQAMPQNMPQQNQKTQSPQKVPDASVSPSSYRQTILK